MLEILSLGAGVQSTTLLLMSENGILPRLDYAIFADTQWEPSYVYSHLEWLKTKTSIPIITVSAGSLPEETLAKKGKDRIGDSKNPPFFVQGDKPGIGMLWRGCTKYYKIQPIERKIREILGLRRSQRISPGVHVRQWRGISVDEMHRAGCSRTKWIVNIYPLIDLRMRRHDCLQWLEKHGFPLPKRSACLGCPYRSDAEWRFLQQESPEDWEKACKFDDALRIGLPLPGVRGQTYLHKSAIPLRLLGSFETQDEKSGQYDLFSEKECSGMCGV